MSFLTPFYLALPIILSGLFFILLFLTFFKRGQSALMDAQITLKIPLIDLGAIRIDLSTAPQIWACRLVFAILGLVLLFLHADRDYGSFVPKKYNITVAFDDATIQKSLALYPSETLKQMKVDADISSWPVRRAIYTDQVIATTLAKALHRDQKDVLTSARFGCTVAHGETRIMIERLNEGLTQLQAYELEDSNGTLQFDSKCDGLNPSIFQSRFRLTTYRDDNFIRATMKQVFSHPWADYPWAIFTKPRYSQYGVDDKTGNEIWGLELHVLTRLTFFPYPRIDNSIYLFEDKHTGYLVPLASATYIERP